MMVELGLDDQERSCLLSIYAVDQQDERLCDERWIAYGRISGDAVETVTRTVLKALAARGWIVWQDAHVVQVRMTTLGRKFAKQLSPS
jgi:hypothetical protein